MAAVKALVTFQSKEANHEWPVDPMMLADLHPIVKLP